MVVENWHKDKQISHDYNTYFTDHKLDKLWDEWWESTFKDNFKLTDYNTHEFIISCFKKALHTNRYDETNIINY